QRSDALLSSPLPPFKVSWKLDSGRSGIPVKVFVSLEFSRPVSPISVSGTAPPSCTASCGSTLPVGATRRTGPLSGGSSGVDATAVPTCAAGWQLPAAKSAAGQVVGRRAHRHRGRPAVRRIGEERAVRGIPVQGQLDLGDS